MRSLLSGLLIVMAAAASTRAAGGIVSSGAGPAAPTAAAGGSTLHELQMDPLRGEPELGGLTVRGGPFSAQRAIEPPGGRQPPEEGDLHRDGGERRRSPLLAGLLSAVVPGAGQLYNRDRLGYLFFGIEAAAWVARISLRQTGQDLDGQFKRFADAHWSWARYRDPNSGPCPPGWGHSDNGVNDSTLVFLYETRRNDYYEDLGKIDLYGCGWDDPDNREIYRDMRANSNAFLRDARRAGTVVFLNHLVSAIHAARGAAGENRRLTGGTEIDLKWSAERNRPLASLVLTHRF